MKEQEKVQETEALIKDNLAKFRVFISDSQEICNGEYSDAFLLPFLRSHKFRVSEALENLKRYTRYVAANNLSNIPPDDHAIISILDQNVYCF